MPRGAESLRLRLRALEDRLLSDDWLKLKQASTWLVSLCMVAYCGLGSDFIFPPNHMDYLQAPARFEGAPVSFFYSPLHKYPAGPGFLFRTYVGWVPLRTPVDDYSPWQVRSLAGNWHADGTVSVTEQMTHTNRELKVQLSALSTLFLAIALPLRYARRREA